eukprot:gnl/Spiro4/13181_TR6990_c0_g1_i1.p2 gnl/Spiro4/13181_TR6990_c0_g1~~gnl/Spiro4/13181_TR6990_c0_g1_i1.p2  ORF type:complete len:132 (+),score=18.41 gnl/Spiro4/13181_TR6990_c0_g1_i1:1000-1395(+)
MSPGSLLLGVLFGFAFQPFAFKLRTCRFSRLVQGLGITPFRVLVQFLLACPCFLLLRPLRGLALCALALQLAACRFRFGVQRLRIAAFGIRIELFLVRPRGVSIGFLFRIFLPSAQLPTAHVQLRSPYPAP